MHQRPPLTAARRAALAALAAVSLGGLAASPAQAAFPGANGRLAVASYDSSMSAVLQTVEADGSDLRTLVSTGPDLGMIRHPQYSGDGARLLFSYRHWTDDGDLAFDGLATYELATGALTTLPHRADPDSTVAWSADGTRVAYTRQGKPDRFGGRTVLYVADADGSGERRIGDGSHPAFSPDGLTLAYEARAVVKRGRAAGGGIVLADARTGERIRRLVAQGAAPDWAPRGRRLVYVTTGTHGGRLAVVGRDGNNRRLLRGRRVTAGQPVFSPDGRAVAYIRRVYQPGSDEHYGYEVWIRLLRTGADRRVLRTAWADAEDGGQFADIAWQPRR